ncbi:MAG: ATP-binding cassette domain-containing protein, partial [Synergistaceae bacterium]|nr:ATP-binding cassette domain-containing protein [Synergistaceae bacterium]
MDGLTVRGVVKSFGLNPSGLRPFGRARGGAAALKGVTAEIRGGKITGLVGPDGAGKTTLLRLFCGLLTPDEGSVSVLGIDPASRPGEARARIGYMPQRFGLYEDLSVMENLRLHADLRGVPADERKARYGELLSFTGLEPFTGRLAGRLSGGMKQKLGLACTLLSRPPVLLLDEPGVGVDPAARRELWRMVRSLLTDGGRVVVWSTAYLDEAEACDTVLLLNEGTLLHDGPPGELSARARGRVFAIDPPAGVDRRALAAPLMKRPYTLDAVIQGRRVRVVTRDGGEGLRADLGAIVQELGGSGGPRHSELECVAPRFEDAFMDMLGGARAEEDWSAVIRDFRGSAPGESGTNGNVNEEVVGARNLTKKFGSFTAVADVSFSIRRGEIFGLLGPNGAGKSTIFKMMCGLLTPTSGECSIAGIDFRKAPGRARSRLGYMAQKFSLYGDLSARQNLEFFSGAYGLRGVARKERVERAIEAFGLSWYLRGPAHALPPGYKQRLAMACAVMHGPDVLFLDEPTSGVDPVTRREFWTA